jgi:hypothetical protein
MTVWAEKHKGTQRNTKENTTKGGKSKQQMIEAKKHLCEPHKCWREEGGRGGAERG